MRREKQSDNLETNELTIKDLHSLSYANKVGSSLNESQLNYF